MLAILNNLVDLLTGSVWAYPLLFGICVGDAVFPALPSETAAIVAGIQAGRGQLTLGWVIALAALGAFVGDNTSYALGRWLGRPVQQRRFLEERGSYVLSVARFVPGGRTATTFTAGLVKLPWLRRFAPYIAIAAVLWGCYTVLLGYLGGRTFRDHPMYALLLAFGIAALVTGVIELVRRTRASRPAGSR
jgi:membrane-associated protein